MKKYLQITIVLGAFFLLVFLKNLPSNLSAPINKVRNLEREDDDAPQTIGTQQQKSLVSQTPTPANPSFSAQKGQYKDGVYTGSVEDVFYGPYQVQAVITNGRISDIKFLQYPNDNRTSIFVNEQSMPILKSEAITAQNAKVDIVSGASDSSQGFITSLTNALKQAK